MFRIAHSWPDNQPVAHESTSRYSHAAPPIWNFLRGTVVALTEDQMCKGCRIQLDEEGRLTVKWSHHHFEHLCVRLGQVALARISSHDILLAAPGYFPVSQDWNEWEGRIVLVDSWAPTPIITVKMRGQAWTVKSTAPVLGMNRMPRTWDSVMIYADPEHVHLRTRGIDGVRLHPRLLVPTSQNLEARWLWTAGE